MSEFIVIRIPVYYYLAFVIVLSVIWAIWIGKDVLGRGERKYSVKRRVLGYVGSGVVLGWLWWIFAAFVKVYD
ncbi:MAG: hypothetical protein JSW22_07835 [Chloroflexota bacterium]|nr:MAG: hypothetical protein JSW22_07835 [Chloroflexota bacterium]